MMRQGPNKRPRGRGGNNNNNNNNNNGGGRRSNVPMRMQTFDSNGPDVRIRGSAFQVHEKYLTLARDATASGDRIMAENYFQHAEHYYRIINAQELGPDGQRRPRQEGGYNGQENYSGGTENEGEERPEPYNNAPERYNNGNHPQPVMTGEGPQPELSNTRLPERENLNIDNDREEFEESETQQNQS